MTHERRNQEKRGEVVRRVVENVVQNPSAVLTLESFQKLLDVPEEVARRLLSRLSSAGLIVEVQRGGVWKRTAA